MKAKGEKKRTRAKPVTQTAAIYDGSIPLPDVKQELFCELYTSNMTPRFFGSGQECYAYAYGHQSRIDEIDALLIGPARERKGHSIVALKAEQKRKRHISSSAGARLLTTVDIKARCNYLMDQLFNDEIMDRELMYTLQQRHDLGSKMVAWGHAAKLRNRIRDKVDVTHEFKPIEGFTYVRPEKPAKAK